MKRFVARLMGWPSRLKENPDRGRDHRDPGTRGDRDPRELAAAQYVLDPSQPFEDAVRAAAMHEAGHVVAAIALGYRVNFAILRGYKTDKERGVGGYTKVTLDFLGSFDSKQTAFAAATTPDALRIRSMQALAGQVAESFINRNGDDIDKGAEDDTNEAIALAMHALGPAATPVEWTDYINSRIVEVAQILTPQRPALARVANHLMAHVNEDVPGDVLKELVKSDGSATDGILCDPSISR